MPKVKCTCRTCGKVFERFPSKAKNGRGLYCSNQCVRNDEQGKWRIGSPARGLAIARGWAKRPRKPPPIVGKECEQCGRHYKVETKYRKQRFCSRKCASESQKKRVKCVCKRCGNEFEVKPSNAGRGRGIFCSRACFFSYLSREKSTGHIKKVSTTSKLGYAYILLADNGLYKIGRTQNFNKRLLQIRPRLPYDLEPIAVIETEDMYRLEKELHEKWADKRKKGEWFELEDEDIEYLKGLENG